VLQNDKALIATPKNSFGRAYETDFFCLARLIVQNGLTEPLFRLCQAFSYFLPKIAFPLQVFCISTAKITSALSSQIV
jgi:hypothetical protein